MKIRIREGLIRLVKQDAENAEERKNFEKSFLRLMFALIFVGVVERVYSTLAEKALMALMTPQPLIRSEQFTLSILIEYPKYALVAVMSGLFMLLFLNSLTCLWYYAAPYLYRRLSRHHAQIPSDTAENTGVSHD